MIETPLRPATGRTDPHGSDDVPGHDVIDALRTTVEDGVVVLVGTVPDVASWSAARDAALHEPRAVVADVTVLPGMRPCAHPERAVAVARAVQAAILRAGTDTSVLVHCDGPVTTLWGRAANRQDRSDATVAAWSVPGVGYVQNWIRED